MNKRTKNKLNKFWAILGIVLILNNCGSDYTIRRVKRNSTLEIPSDRIMLTFYRPKAQKANLVASTMEEPEELGTRGVNSPQPQPTPKAPETQVLSPSTYVAKEPTNGLSCFSLVAGGRECGNATDALDRQLNKTRADLKSGKVIPLKEIDKLLTRVEKAAITLPAQGTDELPRELAAVEKLKETIPLIMDGYKNNFSESSGTLNKVMSLARTLDIGFFDAVDLGMRLVSNPENTVSAKLNFIVPERWVSENGGNNNFSVTSNTNATVDSRGNMTSMNSSGRLTYGPQATARSGFEVKINDESGRTTTVPTTTDPNQFPGARPEDASTSRGFDAARAARTGSELRYRVKSQPGKPGLLYTETARIVDSIAPGLLAKTSSLPPITGAEVTGQHNSGSMTVRGGAAYDNGNLRVGAVITDSSTGLKLNTRLSENYGDSYARVDVDGGTPDINGNGAVNVNGYGNYAGYVDANHPESRSEVSLKVSGNLSSPTTNFSGTGNLGNGAANVDLQNGKFHRTSGATESDFTVRAPQINVTLTGHAEGNPKTKTLSAGFRGTAPLQTVVEHGNVNLNNTRLNGGMSLNSRGLNTQGDVWTNGDVDLATKTGNMGFQGQNNTAGIRTNGSGTVDVKNGDRITVDANLDNPFGTAHITGNGNIPTKNGTVRADVQASPNSFWPGATVTATSTTTDGANTFNVNGDANIPTYQNADVHVDGTVGNDGNSTLNYDASWGEGAPTERASTEGILTKKGDIISVEGTGSHPNVSGGYNGSLSTSTQAGELNFGVTETRPDGATAIGQVKSTPDPYFDPNFDSGDGRNTELNGLVFFKDLGGGVLVFSDEVDLNKLPQLTPDVTVQHYPTGTTIKGGGTLYPDGRMNMGGQFTNDTYGVNGYGGVRVDEQGRANVNVNAIIENSTDPDHPNALVDGTITLDKNGVATAQGTVGVSDIGRFGVWGTTPNMETLDAVYGLATGTLYAGDTKFYGYGFDKKVQTPRGDTLQTGAGKVDLYGDNFTGQVRGRHIGSAIAGDVDLEFTNGGSVAANLAGKANQTEYAEMRIDNIIVDPGTVTLPIIGEVNLPTQYFPPIDARTFKAEDDSTKVAVSMEGVPGEIHLGLNDVIAAIETISPAIAREAETRLLTKFDSSTTQAETQSTFTDNMARWAVQQISPSTDAQEQPGPTFLDIVSEHGMSTISDLSTQAQNIAAEGRIGSTIADVFRGAAEHVSKTAAEIRNAFEISVLQTKNPSTPTPLPMPTPPKSTPKMNLVHTSEDHSKPSPSSSPTPNLLTDKQLQHLTACFKSEAYFLAADVIMYLDNGIDSCGDQLVIAVQSADQPDPVNVTASFKNIGELTQDNGAHWIISKIIWQDSITNKDLIPAWIQRDLADKEELSTGLLLQAIVAVRQNSISYARYIADEQCRIYKSSGFDSTEICEQLKQELAWELFQAVTFQDFAKNLKADINGFKVIYEAYKKELKSKAENNN